MGEMLYSDIVPLLSNGDSKVRRYALEQMIRNIDRLEQKSLLSIFGNAVDDEDEDVSKAAPNGIKWFQIYMCRDRSVTESGIKRAEKAGYGHSEFRTD